jgi:ribonuclease HI
LARLTFLSIKRPTPKRKKVDLDTAAFDHDALLREASSNTVLCYSDGSASPNPGPCGAGVSLFLQNPDLLFDFGESLGYGSNNYAELFALGIIFSQILLLHRRFPVITRAVVFSDSKLALNAAVSRKSPLTNGPITRAVRKAYDAALAGGVSVTLQWVRGHVDIGGNERVDKISKAYASIANNSSPASFNDNFHAHATEAPWAYGFPLSTLPVSVFTRGLPSPPLPALRAPVIRSSARNRA